MARLTGIPERTYRRIENGKIFNPGIRHLANIARVLGIDPETHLANVCEPEWLEWQIFHKDSPKEPPPYEEYPDRFTNAEDY